MSDKFFFKGRKSPKPKHESFGYNTKRTSKLGSSDNPLNLVVCNDARKVEIEALLNQHDLIANIEINSDVEENILELDGILNKPETTRFDKKPNRNEPCPCGSGNKYKKCCG
ncbi:SEC-C domain-containing protein [Shewanella sp. D64]|uniref:PBPRA1643 family SWIM/SEC-C metal-binding motif protein n=1 Tax=unclassified Shewanella TaxID=196818 RepID=UPI0022BA5F76|nr:MULTISPECIES: PBPRA1643 family SWIM/SEC-C metal-binding motif protein [unclassified Shewanella]MEC4727004.1 SEC-C domain-containing protein [Shewanella sp. D64]MEC4737743.1 SEC-C domain-containing protein [Shewanella sp. E94]WBJ93993.1 SEC-C domain-containing protein [Shewanella sp. MTB7]